MKHNFTYHLKDNKHNITSIRFNQYNEHKTVLTIYYPFNSIFFYYNYNYLIGDDVTFIYEMDNEHQMEFHKTTQPYQWHMHLLVNNHKLIKLIDLLFKMLDLSMNDYKMLENIINNDNITKLPNIEYKGSNNKTELTQHVGAIKFSYYNNSVLKYDSIDPYYSAANYLTRLGKINFDVKENIYNKIKNFSENLPKDSNFIKILKSIYPSVDYKNIKYNQNDDDWMINLILFSDNNDKQTCDEMNKYFNVNNQILRIKLMLIAIKYPNRIKQLRRTNLKQYVNTRLNIELGWSIIQHHKGIELHKHIINDMIKLSKNINNSNISKYHKLCNEYINLKGIAPPMKLIYKTKRLSALD